MILSFLKSVPDIHSLMTATQYSSGDSLLWLAKGAGFQLLSTKQLIIAHGIVSGGKLGL